MEYLRRIDTKQLATDLWRFSIALQTETIKPEDLSADEANAIHEIYEASEAIISDYIL